MTIRALTSEESYPMHLLLLADPEERVIQAYLHRSKCYVKEFDGHIVGTYVLLPTRPGTVELINIAVEKQFQNKGIGKELIKHAVNVSREMGCKTLEIGTGNSSIGQLYFYQKCGFRMIGIDKDFFIRHYDEPIFENGLPCRDMIRLQYDL